MSTMTDERAAKPYGDVAYADPKNGKYPIDTEAHIRAAWAYINMPKNAATYPLNGVTLESVKSRIRAAMKRIGADVEDAASAGRPDLELLKRRRNSMIRLPERRGVPFARGNIELRARPNGTGGTAYEFRGYSATFTDEFQVWDKWGDPFLENLAATGVDRTLREKPDTRFFIGHNDSDLALARTAHGNHPGTMTLSRDSHGLETFVPALDGRSSRVMDLVISVERGDMDQMSIGFVTRGQEWSADYEHRTLTDIDLHDGDVSVVAIPANPATSASIAAVPVSDALSRRWAAAMPVNGAAGWDHEPMTGTHAHPHNNFGDNTADETGAHRHDHFHADDADHDHMHPEVGPNDRAARHPHEHRGNPVDQDLGDYSDYGYTGQQKCTNTSCAHQADLQPPAAKVCAYCGDALVRLDDQGVPGMEEEQGAQAALALRRRRLELLALAR